MTTLLILLVVFGILYFLNKFMVDGLLSTIFVGRLTLIFVIFLSGGFYINTALKITEATPGATEMQRNLLYFFGLFQMLIVLGLIFIKSLKWTSIVLIVSLVTLILLNIFGVFTGFNFLGEKNSGEQGLSKMFGYFILIVWTYLFGIHFKGGEGMIGWKGVGEDYQTRDI